MGSTSASGIGCAVRTGAWPISLLLLAAPLLASASPPGRLDVTIEGLRNGKGVLRLCLTRDPHHFPDCEGDPANQHLSVAASAPTGISFGGLASGDYALALFHDENGNARLDTFLKVPREGFGFSRNPAIRFGAPSFDDARISITSGENDQTVRLRYIL